MKMTIRPTVSNPLRNPTFHRVMARLNSPDYPFLHRLRARDRETVRTMTALLPRVDIYDPADRDEADSFEAGP